MRSDKPKSNDAFTKENFYEAAKLIFDFLVTDYGFNESEQSQLGRETHLTYNKSPVAVSVVYEHNSMPDIRLEWVSDAETHFAHLLHLTKQLIPPRYPKLTESVAEMSVDSLTSTLVVWMGIQASFLKKHGKRFLVGDYSRISRNFAEAMKLRARAKAPPKKNPNSQD